MREYIQLDEICISPHIEPYEAYLQFDRLKNGEEYDRGAGLYGQISSIFPITLKDTTRLFSEIPLFPHKEENKISPEDLESHIYGVFPHGSRYYAYEDLLIPGSGKPATKAGNEITQNTIRKILKHNKAALKDKHLERLQKIKVLDLTAQEIEVLSPVLNRDDFDPQYLSRQKQITVELKGYSLETPFPKESFQSRTSFLKELRNRELACRKDGSTLRAGVKLHLELRENTTLMYKNKNYKVNTAVRPRSALLGYFPIFTERGTFIIDGKERTPVAQLLPAPGIHVFEESPHLFEKVVYSLVIQSALHFTAKLRYRTVDKDKKRYRVGLVIENSEIDLVNFLKATGQEELVCSLVKKVGVPWPETIEEHEDSGLHDDDTSFFRWLGAENKYHLEKDTRERLINHLKTIYMEISPDDPFPSEDYLTPKDFAALLIYLYWEVQRIQSHGADTADLNRLKVWLLPDQLKARMYKLLPQIRTYIISLLRSGNVISSSSLNMSSLLSESLDDFYKGSLCQITDDVNPLAEVSQKRQLTLRGPGGVHKRYTSLQRRGVDPSHYGRVCLTETPESESIGLNLYLALAAKVKDGTIKAPYTIPDNDSKTVWLSPSEDKFHTILPKGYAAYQGNSKKVLARTGGIHVKPVYRKDATLIDKYYGQFLGLAASLIPFVQHNENNRVMMGAKNMKQALPLMHPEKPLIKTGREEIVARISGHAIYAINEGIVESIDNEKIVVMGTRGKDVYWLRPLMPTFFGTLSFHRPVVKVGERVGKDQVLADGACTKDGVLALGTNLLVAYMPYHGLNFEDGIVISDRLVRDDKLTSLHLRSVVFEVLGDERMTSTDKSLRMLPFSQYHGCLCREGQQVRKGDALFAKYKKKNKKTEIRWLHSPVNGTIISISKVQVRPETSSPAQVRYKIICDILEKRKIAVGDKLMGRHGNKGVVSRILPIEQMPHLEDGTPVDIVLNPHGVISRMNLGQILETHVGWIVKHGGREYERFATITPFERISETEIKDALKTLKHTGIDENGKAVLIDGRTGTRIQKPVVVGYQYFLKLNHLAEDKFNCRETGPYTLITRQPTKGKKLRGGQRIGEMEGWALQAHLAKYILREFMTLKSDGVDARKKELTAQYFDADSTLHEKIPFPETLRSTVVLLRGLCLELDLYAKSRKKVNLRSKTLSPLASAKLKIADPRTIKRWAKNRQVTSFRKERLRGGKIEREPGGLFDPVIFKDPREDMAYIELVEPVIHPLFFNLLWQKIKCLPGEEDLPDYLLKLFELNNLSDIQAALRLRKVLVVGPSKFDNFIIEPYKIPSVPLSYQTKSCRCGQITDESDDERQCPNCGETVEDRRLPTQFLGGSSFLNYMFKENIKEFFGNLLITHIPVLPLDYRPAIARQGELKIKSELNDFYRFVLKANERLKQALTQSNETPSGLDLFYLRRSLQNAVNRLMVGDKRTKQRKQRSLVDYIKGKQGILRQCLLGKRVDVSARSVIVPDPELNLGEVGIPLEMVAGLARSKLMDILSSRSNGKTPRARKRDAEHILDNLHVSLYRDMIKDIIFNPSKGLWKDAYVILNRAPSLHKYNMLAFRPVCVEHKAIGLHPLVCKFFNADFDGDQMGVFLPLSREAMAEAGQRMTVFQNLLSAANGRLLLHLDQEIVLGIYLLTSKPEGRRKLNSWLKGARMKRISQPITGPELRALVETFHSRVQDPEKTAALCQKIMEEGFKEATLSGMTFSIFDVPFLGEKEKAAIVQKLPPGKWKQDAIRKLADRCGIM